MKLPSFPHLLHSFFHEWLVQQRNISHHTVISYRDRLAVVSPVRRRPEEQTRFATRHGRANGIGCSGILTARGTGAKDIDRNAELQVGRAAQFLQLRRRP